MFDIFTDLEYQLDGDNGYAQYTKADDSHFAHQTPWP